MGRSVKTVGENVDDDILTTEDFPGKEGRMGNFFFIMYFSLPDSIPPRPLGEARVRKHCVMLLYGRVTNHKIYIINYIVCYLVHVI
jgi:hypothetical protein